jgi:flagellar biosynthesis/type III secretory pathway protein FliH
MTDFCVGQITVEESLRPEHGVLRVASLSITSDARVAAERIVQQARAEADALTQEARGNAENAVREAEQKVLQRANELLTNLKQTNELFLQHAQSMVVDLAQCLFDRLVMETTPRDRIEAAFKRVHSEGASSAVNAVLRVHPEDFDLLPALEWEVKADPAMARGVCRLEAGNGEWCADFSAAADALKAAFQQAVQDLPGNEEPS